MPDLNQCYTPWCSNPDRCAVGVDLTGHPSCEGCGGYGVADTNNGGQKTCGPEVSRSHIGDGSEVKPGPITGCPKWEPIPAVPAQSSPSEWS